jgi:hypothetical protein
MSIHATKGAQENATAAAILVKHLGELLISAEFITKAQAASVAQAAEADANALKTASAPAIAEIIRTIGQQWAQAR